MNYPMKLGLTCLGTIAVIFLPWILFITFKMCTAERVEKEIHLIPKDYRGDVFILFNHQDGIPPKYSDKKERIYEIPNTGVLKTKFAPNRGGFSRSDRRFYYVDKDKNNLRRFKWVSAFELYHKTYKKTDSTIKEDSLLVFNLTNKENIVIDSIPGIKLDNIKDKDLLFYTIDSFKYRLKFYKQ